VELPHFNGYTVLVFGGKPALSEAEQLIFFLYDVVLDKIVELRAE
jgi:hypothetical protein